MVITMKKYLFKYKFLMILASILIIASEALSIFLAKIFGEMVDAGVSRDWRIFRIYIILGIGFVLTDVIITLLGRYELNKYIKKTVTDIKDDIVNAILNMDIERFKKYNSATYISILNNDIGVVERNYLTAIPYALARVISLCLAVFLLLKINWILAVFAVFINLLPLTIPFFKGKKLSEQKAKSMKSLERYNIQIKDVLTGFDTIKSNHIEKHMTKLINKSNSNAQNQKCASDNLSATASVLSMGMTELVIIVTLLAATLFAITGHITVGSMIMAVQLANQIANPVRLLSEQYTNIKEVKQINVKIGELLNYKAISGKQKINLDDEFKEICIENMDFKYPDCENNALSDINLTLKRSGKYAVVGSSGSGKSTLTKLIQGYYDKYSGKILINGHNINLIKKESLYRYISIIQQDVFMFDDTIANNVTLYNDYNISQIKETLNKVGLTEKMDELGIYYNIAEAGGHLSGGERQRVAIARAIIRKTPILIMDEATSGLDNKIEDEIYTSILEMDDIMSIIVTHKLTKQLLKKMDAIIVMKNGTIVECDNFNNLMDKKGEFFNLYNVYN